MNILGTFDAIWAKQVPVVFQQCAIALRIRFDAIEEGAHSLTINFVDFDGKHIVPSLKGKINIRPQPKQKTLTENIVLNLQKIKFESFGEFSVDLAIDEKHISSVPLYLVEQPNRN